MRWIMRLGTDEGLVWIERFCWSVVVDEHVGSTVLLDRFSDDFLRGFHRFHPSMPPTIIFPSLSGRSWFPRVVTPSTARVIVPSTT